MHRSKDFFAWIWGWSTTIFLFLNGSLSYAIVCLESLICFLEFEDVSDKRLAWMPEEFWNICAIWDITEYEGQNLRLNTFSFFLFSISFILLSYNICWLQLPLPPLLPVSPILIPTGPLILFHLSQNRRPPRDIKEILHKKGSRKLGKISHQNWTKQMNSNEKITKNWQE